MPTYAHTLITGTTDTYEHPIGFLYSRASDVQVYIENTLITEGSGATQYIFSSSGTKITFTDPNEPQTGEILEIRRVTDVSSAVVTFASGGGATKADLNAAVLQMLRAVDELQYPALAKSWTLSQLQAGDITWRTFLDDNPSRVEVWWECTDADLNYAAGTFLNNSTLATPLTYRSLDTSDGFIITNQRSAFDVLIPDIVGGAETSPNASKWTVHFKAWR